MRRYILLALILLAGGIGVSFYLIPTADEVASHQATDVAAVDLGKVDIEAEYAAGRRTFPIVNALAEKRIAEGNRPAAVKLLEEFVAANPAEINGHKKLAEQYQLSGNQAGFNKELEVIAAAAPTEANLRMLSDIYNFNKDYGKQVEVLKKLVEVTKGEDPKIWADLATMQDVVGDQAGALSTIESLRAKHPQFVSYPLTRVTVSLLAAKGDVDGAYAAAKQWMDRPLPTPAQAALPADAGKGVTVAPAIAVAANGADTRPQELADLCDILHYSGHADKAVALVEAYPGMLDHAPALALSYVNAAVTAGQTEKAYTTLRTLDEAGGMVASLYPVYLDLTLKREDVAGAETIANKLDVASFTEEQALNTLETARAHAANSVLVILSQRFSQPAYAKDKPVLVAVIALLANDKTQDEKIGVALNAPLTSALRLRLAEACARSHKTQCFDTMVKQYPPLEQMTTPQVAEYSQLFILADRASELVDPVGKLAMAERAPLLVQHSHRRLASAAGRAEVMKPWTAANATTAPVGQLQEYFYLANDRHHGEVASDLAERLYARDPSPMNREIMISAYLNAENYAKALPLLRDKMKEPGTNDGVYLSVLSKLAHKDEAARKELADYAEAALKSGHGDARQQLNYTYILINNGRKDAALPTVRANASSQGGEWKKILAQLTAKPGSGTAAAPAKLSREQLLAMAESRSISAANKRQIAFNLLHDGYKDDATKLFEQLAENKGPESQEVKDLLYLWGGKLSGKQLEWVEARASHASAYDKSRWAQIVLDTADDRSLLAYVSATPDALYHRELRQKYFRVLASTGSRAHYETAMRDWVAQTTDVPALLDYAKTGQDAGYREGALAGYERVLTLDPANSKALAAKGVLDYAKGKYTSADRALNQYIASPPPQQLTNEDTVETAQAHFYKGQLLRRQGNQAAAKAEFQQVVAMTPSVGASVDALSRRYTAQFHLGQHAEAKQGFNQLLAAHPDDQGVLADYMSVLIEYRYLEEATRVANQYDKSSPYYGKGKGAALVGYSSHAASVERFSEGRELKISFDRPIEGKAPLAKERPSWLASSEAGYDSLTLSAKPGYVLRFTPTAQEQFAVVAAPTADSPQIEAQRQAQLRLQLLYAQIEQNSGQLDKARTRIKALKYYYPNDPQVLSYEAAIESARGNNSRALALVNEAKTYAPENEALTLQAENIRQVDRGTSYVKLDHEYRALGKNDEQITTASGALRVGRMEFGIEAQNDFLNSDQIRRASDGRVGNYDADRQRGELYAAYNLGDGARAKASLFANNSTLGTGADVEFKNRLGKTELLAEYQRPYWDFVEAVYEHATRDRVGAKHYAELRPGTSLGLEASYNNYNIDEKDSVAQTTLVRANLVQQLQPKTASQPYLGIGYGFDGEYLSGKPDQRLDGLGNGYYLLPVRDREVHALTGIYRSDWTPNTHALIVGGAAYDRINESFSPLAEVRVDQDLTKQWQVGGRARYALETNNTDNHALNVGADMLYKF